MISTEPVQDKPGGALHRAARPHARSRALPLAALVSIALLLLPALVRFNGTPHADWLQFLGRFHPLAVHLPIGLIVLIPVFEIAGRRRPALRESAGLVLALATCAALGSLLLGAMLAYGAGDSGSTLYRHLWGAIILCIALLACVLTRPAWAAGRAHNAYPALLVCVELALLWTAHQGGSLTHGVNYLTRYMPAALKRLAPVSRDTAASPGSFYSQQIQPIFDSKCVSCHGASKIQGGLRLDSYNQAMRGGKDGAVIAPNHPERSILLTRITLPPTDKLFMPAEHTPLPPAQIALIRAWIEHGASPTDTRIAGVALPAAPKDPPLQPVGDYSSLEPEIQRMLQGQGPKLMPLSAKPSDGLILNTVDSPGAFTDAQLATFLKFAPYLVEANLARTAITDASLDTLAKFTHLRALHLEGTALTGSGLAKLAPLTQLTYLNLSGTKVTPQSIAPLRKLPNLHHLYLFNTAADTASSTPASPTP